jgi:hypothetical protein
MREASITVTATASTSVPKGSPTRWATTSAWWTEAITPATRAMAQSTPRSTPAPSARATTRRTSAIAGTIQLQSGMARS